MQANLIDATALDEAGVTPEQIQTKDWDALASTSDKLFEQDGSKIKRIGYDPKLPDSFPQWAMANGASIVGDDGAPNLDDPKAVEALEFTVDLVDRQGGWTKFKAFRDSYDIFGEKNPLTVHSIAAFPMENWYVNVLRDSIPAGLKLQSTPFTDRQGQPMSLLGGSAWAIPKGAKNPVAACAWAKTMTSTDTWLKAAEARAQKVAEDKSFFTGLFTANKAADDQIREKYLEDAPDPGFKAAIDNFYALPRRGPGAQPLAGGRRDRRRVEERGVAGPRGPGPRRRPWRRPRRRRRRPTRRCRPMASRLQRRETRAALGFISPWIIGFFVFTAGPDGRQPGAVVHRLLARR